MGKKAMGKMNYYSDSVAIEKAGQQDLHQIYRVIWPGIVNIDNIRGKDPQFYGLDDVIYLEGNRVESAQAKIRKKNWSDILLEYISNDKTGSPGWMESRMLCHHFFVLMMAGNVCYYFYFPDLREAWNRHKQEWIKLGEQKSAGFNRIRSENPGYDTISVGVPLKVLFKEVPLHRTFRKENGIWK